MLYVTITQGLVMAKKGQPYIQTIETQSDPETDNDEKYYLSDINNVQFSVYDSRWWSMSLEEVNKNIEVRLKFR